MFQTMSQRRGLRRVTRRRRMSRRYSTANRRGQQPRPVNASERIIAAMSRGADRLVAWIERDGWLICLLSAIAFLLTRAAGVA